ncbi:hypothetical protein ACOSQ4_024655 [Xanthoceras sorbifolium]
MQGRASDTKGKEKATETSKKVRRNASRFNRGMIVVPEDFLKAGSSKWAHVEDSIPRLPPISTIAEPLTIVYETGKTLNVGPDKLSNDDRMQMAAFHTWTAAANGANVGENKRRAKLARRIIAWLKRELPDRAIDRWYMRGSTKTKFLIFRVDPNFDLDKLEEVRTDELSMIVSLQPTEIAPPEDNAPKDSLDKADIDNSNDEVEKVDPAE